MIDLSSTFNDVNLKDMKFFTRLLPVLEVSVLSCPQFKSKRELSFVRGIYSRKHHNPINIV